MVQTPVVVFAFNRPHLTARLVEALRAAAPARVFLVCDGPRPGHPTDAERAAEVRRILETIDWATDVHRRFSAENLGCEASVELGLDWVFKQVDRAIVFEDDCIPHPSFFDFCDELLERYAGDPRVWHIAGNRHDVPAPLFGDDSYAFSTWASVWGWATWSDRWRRHRELFPRDHRLSASGTRDAAPSRTQRPLPQPGTLVTRGAERHFAEAAASSDVVTHGWDKQWWLTIMSQGGLSVTPAVNMVENAGFGVEATHGTVERTLEPAHALALPVRHPERVRLHREVERELELVLSRVGGSAAKLARRVVRSPALRARIRNAAQSRLAATVYRTVSRVARG